MSLTTTDFQIDANAPCMFCSAIPTTTTEVRIDRRATLDETEETTVFAPVCFECERRYSLFKVIWWSAIVISGQIISFTVGYLDPSKLGVPHENAETIFTFVCGGIFAAIPVLLVYRFVDSLTYRRRARKWLRTYTNYYSR